MFIERALRAPAANTLERWYAPETAARIVDEALRRFAEERGSLSVEAGIGGAVMVRLAALTACLYRVLLSSGLTPEEARSRTAEVAWAIYHRMGFVPGAVARFAGRTPEARLRAATDLFRHFPFGPPSYDMRDVDAGAGVVAFDVRRCPVAEYFEEQGLTELCAAAFCDLDHRLAQDWSAALTREHTLARGDDRCDFRWRALRP